MNISRRSFLKLAALSTAAVAVSASMTGCATPWTPSLTITYQEVAASDESAVLFTKTTKTRNGCKEWENGKKVAVSGEKFVTNTLKELDGYKTDEEIINKITAALKEDYPFDDKKKKVILVKEDPEINKSFNSYAITIKFNVVDATCLIV